MMTLPEQLTRLIVERDRLRHVLHCLAEEGGPRYIWDRQQRCYLDLDGLPLTTAEVANRQRAGQAGRAWKPETGGDDNVEIERLRALANEVQRVYEIAVAGMISQISIEALQPLYKLSCAETCKRATK